MYFKIQTLCNGRRSISPFRIIDIAWLIEGTIWRLNMSFILKDLLAGVQNAFCQDLVLCPYLRTTWREFDIVKGSRVFDPYFWENEKLEKYFLPLPYATVFVLLAVGLCPPYVAFELKCFVFMECFMVRANIV